jgi:hypothetical protein
MLCSQNSGKYLSETWHATRDLGIEEIDNIPSELLSFYELDGVQDGPNGKRQIFASTMNIGTKPIDPDNYIEEDYDYRCNPEVGR